MKKYKALALILACLTVFSAIAAFSVSAKEEEITFKTELKDGNLYGLPADSTCANLRSAYRNTIIDVYTKDNAPVASGSTTKIGTGFKIRVNGAYYNAVVYGDVNGDGVIDAKDFTMVKRSFLGTLSPQLDGIYLEAACTEKDGQLRAIDYVKVKRACLGTFNINEKYTCDPYTPDDDMSGWSEGWI